ncbi:MAG: HK97 family phage prohead protease [Candidatus Thiodiazotropha sp. (ex Ctena orbiculata)]|nr:HK97 family phage prohead protease [Candidatus Thiodiazotropha taylori]
MLRKNLSLNDCEIKLDSENGVFSGYASVFGGVDSYGDTIEPGAFEHTLSKHGLPKMFLNHEGWELPIGKWVEAGEDKRGLLMDGELTPGNTRSTDVHASLKHGTIDGLSIGFYLEKDDYEETDEGRIIKRISRLVEVSVVTFPADTAARVDLSSVKSEEIEAIESIRDFERCLREVCGVSKGLTQALISRAKVVFPQGEPVGNELDVKAMGELQRAAERLRTKVTA